MKFKKLKQAADAALGKYKAQSPAAYAAAQQAIGGLLILDGFIGIDNPFGGKKRPGIFGTLGGVVLGVIFLFMPMIFNSFAHLDQLTANTTATVVSVNHSTSRDSDGNTSDSCTAVVRYKADGKEYQQNSSFGSSDLCGFSSGSPMNISYNPNKPGEWGYNVASLRLIINIFVWVGVVVIIVSLFTFVIRLFSIIFGWKLLKSGRMLAKTLPEGTDLKTLIDEIKRDFSGLLFANGKSVVTQVAEAAAGISSSVQPQSVTPPATPPQPATPPDPTKPTS